MNHGARTARRYCRILTSQMSIGRWALFYAPCRTHQAAVRLTQHAMCDRDRATVEGLRRAESAS